ncbi:hypothetical protein BKA65DRAFT_555165 [Rhexocercosporidium sp. MPI-PUGE-AT-0058]|nr:hypothetical protein BKA65DRAFT_555165 [Rhexocercosporidium sp. MPI-PUGE-AT-0058]
MVTPSQVPKHHLNPINTHWHNRSLSSLSATSDAATFHSAHAHLSSNMELRQLPFSQPPQPTILTSLPLQTTTSPQPLPSPKLTAIKMDRQDSGYAEIHTNPTPQSPTSASNSRRTSTSSSVKRLSSPSSNPTATRPKRRTTGSSSSSTTVRPSTKRASRSSTTAQLRTSNPGSRPNLSSRHTTPYTNQQTQQPYQFFQFPSLTDTSPPATTSSNINSTTATPSNQPTTIPHPPPPTIQYWTSDSTRRLEYAAIDAASKGVRGFFIKLIPDCILPPSTRRTKFHCDDDAESDRGSVRRYRLVLPEEKASCSSKVGVVLGGGDGSGKGRGLLRRWTSFGRKSGAMD